MLECNHHHLTSAITKLALGKNVIVNVITAAAQTLGPYGARLVGDLFENIGISLLIAAGLLLVGALIALLQRPL